MNHKQKLAYMALGALILALGITIGQVITPTIEAQNNGVFDDITCRMLVVVDQAGKPAISLTASELFGNVIQISDKEDIAITLAASEDSNVILVQDKAGKGGLYFNASADENIIRLIDKAGKAAVNLVTDRNGNGITVNVPGKDGNAAIVLGAFAHEFLGTAIQINDKTGKKTAINLSVSELLGNSMTIRDQAGRVMWETPKE